MATEATKGDFTIPELERQVFGGMLASISEATKNYLSASDYHGSNPFTKLVKAAVDRKAAELSTLMDDALDSAFSGDFREKLREAAAHKLARVLMAKMEGEIEKRANDLRADPAFRARLTIAIEKAVREA